MTRGTTPYLTFETPIDLRNADRIYLTFSQAGQEVLTLEKSSDKNELSVTVSAISCQLTREQTLCFSTFFRNIEMQIYAQITGNWIASEIMLTNIERILKEV